MQRFPYYSGPTFSYQRLDFVPTGGCISGESFISSTFPILDREFINFKMFFFSMFATCVLILLRNHELSMKKEPTSKSAGELTL